MSFERKLRMMRVDLFSTLLISNSIHFVEKEHESQMIKEGIVEFSKKNRAKCLKAIKVLDDEQGGKLHDWQDMLYYKCYLNQLTDVHVENASEKDFQSFSRGENKEGLFVYANYLVPGIHKFLIYCPTS